MKIPDLKDGQYRQWEMEVVARTAGAVRDAVAVGGSEQAVDGAASPWGLEIHAGWRALVERMLAGQEAAIAAQPIGERDGFRIVQLKEKFGRLTLPRQGGDARDASRD